MVLTIDQIVKTSISSVFTTDWLATSMLALLISAVMSSIAWMISSIFQSKEINAWAKKELSEFIFTGVLLALTVPLLLIITSIVVAYADGDPFTLAKIYLDKVEVEISSIYLFTSSSIVMFSFITNIPLSLGLIVKALATIIAATQGVLPGLITGIVSFFSKFKVTLFPGSPFSLLSNFLLSLNSALTPILLAFFVQKELLLFIQAAALPVLLPTGILLRAFPFSRKAGSTLIAIALTLFVIYPLVLAFVGSMYDITYNKVVGQTNLQTSFSLTHEDLFFRDLPVGGRYRLDYGDEFKWVAAKNISYSIWRDIKCTDIQNPFTSHIISGSLTPIPSENENYLIIPFKDTVCSPDPDGIPNCVEFDVWKCYKKFKWGIADSEEGFGFLIDSAHYPSSENNTNHSILLIAQERNGAFTQVEFFDFFLGDPCKQNAFSKLWCWLGFSAKEDEINDISWLYLSSRAGSSALTGALTSLGLIGGSTITSAFLTPMAAGQVFYVLTDILPIILLPYIFVLFTFVIIIMVSNASFKSISTTIGGETKIIELGRLI